MAVDYDFYDYRSQEILATVQAHLIQESSVQILKRTPILWETLNYPSLFNVNLHSSVLYQLSSINKLSINKLIYALFYLLTVIALYYLIIKKIKIESIESTMNKFNLYVVITTALLTTFTIYFRFIIHATLPFEFLGLKWGIYLVVIARLYIAFLAYGEQISTLQFKRMLILTTLIFTGFAYSYILDSQQLPIQLNQLLKTIYLTLLNLSFIGLLWPIFKLDFFKYQLSKSQLMLSKNSLFVFFATVIIMTWLGYYYVGTLLVINVFSTIVVVIIAFEISRYIGNKFAQISNPKNKYSQKIHAILGVNIHKKLIELSVLRVLLNAPLIAAFYFGLMEMWGRSSYKIHTALSTFQNGFEMIGITIYPSRLLHAANVFCVILLCGRAFAVFASNTTQFQGEKHRQATVAALITYLMFSVALLIALLIAGVNFSRLALIAGALSVGIGFGLQNLASDFVSGLILLITKPVKIGDHVVINLTEGYIKKIGLFSTQMTTLLQSNVIFPNAILINQALNNYTFHDKQWRINIQITLESIGDLKLAEKLLLQIAQENPNVLQTPPNQPIVLFELSLLASGMQCALLDLWCVIKDVDVKHIITSELNAEIITKFLEAGLKIKVG